jgi:hypothetical protein
MEKTDLTDATQRIPVQIVLRTNPANAPVFKRIDHVNIVLEATLIARSDGSVVEPLPIHADHSFGTMLEIFHNIGADVDATLVRKGDVYEVVAIDDAKEGRTEAEARQACIDAGYDPEFVGTKGFPNWQEYGGIDRQQRALNQTAALEALKKSMLGLFA